MHRRDETTKCVVALIPARGGSKGIPRKNIVPVAGRPLIAYTIEQALAAKTVDRVLVSTDDEEIARVARDLGAEVPFLRPEELAGDEVLDLPVFQHALQWLDEHEDLRPQTIVHLRPTSPVRPTGLIDQGVGLLADNPAATSVRSVSEPPQHPFRMFTEEKNGFLKPLLNVSGPPPYLLRRQELPKVAWYNCVLDVSRWSTVMEQQSMTGSRILPLWIEPWLAVDIDSVSDLEVAAVRIRQLDAQESEGTHVG